MFPFILNRLQSLTHRQEHNRRPGVRGGKAALILTKHAFRFVKITPFIFTLNPVTFTAWRSPVLNFIEPPKIRMCQLQGVRFNVVFFSSLSFKFEFKKCVCDKFQKLDQCKNSGNSYLIFCFICRPPSFLHPAYPDKAQNLVIAGGGERFALLCIFLLSNNLGQTRIVAIPGLLRLKIVLPLTYTVRMRAGSCFASSPKGLFQLHLSPMQMIEIAKQEPDFLSPGAFEAVTSGPVLFLCFVTLSKGQASPQPEKLSPVAASGRFFHSTIINNNYNKNNETIKC